MFAYDSLMNFYKTNFNLMQFHKYSLSDLENMLPWERYLYIDLLKDYIKEENEKRRDAEAANKAKGRSVPQRKARR